MATVKHVHGPGIDEPIAQEDGVGALSYFHADGLGSVVKTTNSAGTVTGSRRYDSFGNLELGATNGYAFTGREWDSETGLAFYRARYYDPKLGSFLSEDPVDYRDGLSRYGYAVANPVRFVDPTGLTAVERPTVCGQTCSPNVAQTVTSLCADAEKVTDILLGA